MASPVLHRVCHGTSNPEPWQTQDIRIRPAILHNYRRHRVLGRDYPGLVPVEPESLVDDSNSGEAAPPVDGGGSDGNKAGSSSVRGTLVTGLKDADIWRLDMFEGSQYGKRTVKVRVLEDESQAGDASGNGGDDKLRSNLLNAKETSEQEVEAVTYVWTADKGILEAEEWDFQGFLRDKMHLWAG